MNENIDLTKILKDCPIGWEFYSSIYGNVNFRRIGNNAEYPIVFFLIDKYGIAIHRNVTKKGLDVAWRDGECTFFPSRDQRDWSKFSSPWFKKKKFDPKTLKPFDKVLVYDIYDICEGWACAFFSHIRESDYPYSTSSGSFKVCIPYNDETKHLVGTKEEAPEYYRYWED